MNTFCESVSYVVFETNRLLLSNYHCLHHYTEEHTWQYFVIELYSLHKYFVSFPSFLSVLEWVRIALEEKKK